MDINGPVVVAAVRLSRARYIDRHNDLIIDDNSLGGYYRGSPSPENDDPPKVEDQLLDDQASWCQCMIVREMKVRCEKSIR